LTKYLLICQLLVTLITLHIAFSQLYMV